MINGASSIRAVLAKGRRLVIIQPLAASLIAGTCSASICVADRCCPAPLPPPFSLLSSCLLSVLPRLRISISMVETLDEPQGEQQIGL
jgi:hypothetical protein